MALIALRAPERWGLYELTLGEREWDSREEAACEACILSLGRNRKISGMCLLSCVSWLSGDRYLVAEALWDVLTMVERSSGQKS